MKIISLMMQNNPKYHLLTSASNLLSYRIRLKTSSTISNGHLHYGSLLLVYPAIFYTISHNSMYQTTNRYFSRRYRVRFTLSSCSQSLVLLTNVFETPGFFCREDYRLRLYLFYRLLIDSLLLERLGLLLEPSLFSLLSKRLIVMEACCLQGTKKSILGLGGGCFFTGLFPFDLSLVQNTVKWIFFFDFESDLSYDLDAYLMWILSLWMLLQGRERFLGDGYSSEQRVLKLCMLRGYTSLMGKKSVKLVLYLKGFLLGKFKFFSWSGV